MTPPPFLVAVDARMIQSSGIGVVLRSLLQQWKTAPPPFEIVLLGDPDQLVPFAAASCVSDVVPWRAGVYSLRAAFLPPKLPAGTAVWYSPHYATCLRAGVPSVVMIHDVLHITHPTRRGTSAYMRAYLAGLRRTGTFFLTPSRHVKVQLQTLHGFDAERILIAQNGPGEFEHFPDDAAIRPKELPAGNFVLAVGIHKPHKNWRFLLRELARWPDEELRLVCVGLGDDAEKLQDEAEAQGLGSRATILRRKLSTAELAGAYHAARALVFPSLAEGFGLPVLEAMWLGTPVVAANVSPMREIIGNGGFLYEPDFRQTFRTALAEVLAGGDAVMAKREAALHRSREFSWARFASVTEEAIIGAKTGKRPKPSF